MREYPREIQDDRDGKSVLKAFTRPIYGKRWKKKLRKKQLVLSMKQGS